MRYRTSNLLVLTMFVLVTLCVSCEKDEMEMLTDGTWYFSALTTDSPDPMIISIVKDTEAEMKGGKMTLSSDGTYSLNWSDPVPDETGTWVLNFHSELVLTDETTISRTLFITRIKRNELVLFEGIKDGPEFYSQFATWKR